MSIQVACPACSRVVTAQKWTGYPRRHKNPAGEWCSGVAARHLRWASDATRRDVAYVVRASMDITAWMAYLRAHRPIDIDQKGGGPWTQRPG